MKYFGKYSVFLPGNSAITSRKTTEEAKASRHHGEPIMGRLKTPALSLQ